MQYILVIVSVLGIAAVIWYFFMVPLGRERHERELELIRRKLERHAARSKPAEGPGEQRPGQTGELR